MTKWLGVVLSVSLLLGGCTASPEIEAADTPDGLSLPPEWRSSTLSPEACWEAQGVEYHWRGSRTVRSQMPSCVFVNPEYLLIGLTDECYTAAGEHHPSLRMNKYVVSLLATERGETFEEDVDACKTLPAVR